MNVFDASALLAFLQNEAGADAVEAALDDGGACGAANWSEIGQKVRAHDRDWELARALLLGYGLEIEPVGLEDAEWAMAQLDAGIRPVARRSTVPRARAPTRRGDLDRGRVRGEPTRPFARSAE